jgi:hypothetical protein
MIAPDGFAVTSAPTAASANATTPRTTAVLRFFMCALLLDCPYACLWTLPTPAYGFCAFGTRGGSVAIGHSIRLAATTEEHERRGAIERVVPREDARVPITLTGAPVALFDVDLAGALVGMRRSFIVGTRQSRAWYRLPRSWSSACCTGRRSASRVPWVRKLGHVSGASVMRWPRAR